MRQPVMLSELVLRDGHQSLIATRLRASDMLPILGELDKAGFWSLEVWGGATFDACLRFLKEDPWERLKKIRRGISRTPLQMLLRGQNLVGYRHYADDVVRGFVKKAADLGVDVFRVFDALNDLSGVRTAIESVLEAGRHAQGAICYTVSPLHTEESFVAMAKGLAGMGCQSIAIKDMAGLLTPGAASRLVSSICDAVRLPVHVHTHACAGLAEMSLLAAARAGASILDTAISPFAGGASHPATESMAAALASEGFSVQVDEDALAAIAGYFREVRKKYWQFESPFTGIDPRVLTTQVPGGMISNLAHQLKEQGAIHRMDEVMLEIPKVRADLGYPPLVTPTSQIVGAQAVLNVLTGKRYGSITKEVKQYILGFYGKPPGPIEPHLRGLVEAEKPLEPRQAAALDEELERARAESEAFARSEEDVLTYALFPEVAQVFLKEREAGNLTPEPLLPPEARETPAPQPVPNEFHVAVHGETFHIRVSASGRAQAGPRPYYVYVDGALEEVLVETLGEMPPTQEPSLAAPASRRPRATHEGHVTSPMPGTVAAVLKKPGDIVAAGDPVLVVEAMKMENEIPAPVSGTVISVFANKGDKVNPDEVLMEIRPQ